MTPITGVLRMTNQASTGIMNATGDEQGLRRVRYPRFFDEREIMLAYEKVFSHAYTALQSIMDGTVKNEVILFAFDVSQ